MTDEDRGGTHGYVVSEGVTFVVDVKADGVFAPDDAVLLAAGEEWQRRAQDGEPWSQFTLLGPAGAFTVKITAPGSTSDDAAAGAAAAFIAKVGGSTDTPVAPV